MGLVKQPLPRGSNQWDYQRGPFPFNPLAPFEVTTLGVAKLGAAVAQPAWSTYAHLVQPSLQQQIGIANPVNCTTAGGWWLGLTDCADLVVFAPWAVGYNAGGTAYAAPAAAEAYGVSVWGVRAGPYNKRGYDGQSIVPRSWLAIPMCDLTFTTGPQFQQGDPDLPSSMEASARGRFMDTCTINEDHTLDPGVRVIGTTPGAIAALWDLQGFEALIVYPNVMPANRGFGLWHAYL